MSGLLTGTSSRVAWNIYLMGGDDSLDEYRGRRKLNEYVSTIDGFRCPSDNNPIGISFNGTASNSCSYMYNSNHYGLGGGWVLYGRRLGELKNASRQVSWGDRTNFYMWSYGHWFPDGLHVLRGSEAFHDPPQDNPDAKPQFFEGQYHDAWVYDPTSNVGFLDGHVTFLELGPYWHPGDFMTNTDNYILDEYNGQNPTEGEMNG